jgi:hypothetical protein
MIPTKLRDCIQLEKLSWSYLSWNPAIHLLEANPEKINMRILIRNPAIFMYDYDAMKQATAQLHEELIAYVFHPTRVAKWMYENGTDSEYL